MERISSKEVIAEMAKERTLIILLIKKQEKTAEICCTYDEKGRLENLNLTSGSSAKGKKGLQVIGS